MKTNSNRIIIVVLFDNQGCLGFVYYFMCFLRWRVNEAEDPCWAAFVKCDAMHP